RTNENQGNFQLGLGALLHGESGEWYGTVLVGAGVLWSKMGDDGILAGKLGTGLLGLGKGLGFRQEWSLVFGEFSPGKNDPWTWILDKLSFNVNLFLRNTAF
nr:hypothetical protein [Tanacetum cinerariifolium]